MATMRRSACWLLLLLLCPAIGASAQEVVAPLRYNPSLDAASALPAAAGKTTALSLPFFEDFTDYSLYPSGSRWIDSSVYVNNTMGVDVISRGVATMDALNRRGRPYDTVNMFNNVYADSLTSQPIDLSIYSPGDSIYLSFFYQPQGYGFSPETADSLMLFFRPRSGGWRGMWSVAGASVEPFRQVMIPAVDTDLFHDGFQFRFVNKASINTNDDVWNLDYIRMGISRSLRDTAVRDLAYTINPGYLLNDYTYMPYRQYLANASGERAPTLKDTIRNNYGTGSTVTYGYQAVETTTGTPLSSATGSISIPAYSKGQASFPAYSATVTPPSSTSRIVYRNTWFLSSGGPTEPRVNDTIVREQVFDNFLAYDDGTAEKSYFLNLAQSLPGKTAIEFRLNAPDTLRGVAIYFGQQAPSGFNKSFSVAAYSKLAGIAGANSDTKLFEQSDLLPLYTDEINQFTVYKFDSPIELPAGVFYLGTTQPASSGSDSLYLGLDANRIGGNHLYVNLLGTWQPSVVSGALMIRPLLGRPVTGTDVPHTRKWSAEWSFYPNPAGEAVHIRTAADANAYAISDLQGRVVARGVCHQNIVPVSALSPGLYLLRIRQGDTWSLPQKLIKQ